MSDLPVAFHDLPAASFPFIMECVNASGDVVWSVEVTGPGAIYVPPLATFYGPLSGRIRFPDGEVVAAPPPH